MQAVRPRMSYADLERLPDDGCRYELYDGLLSEVPAPIPRHQRVSFNVAEQLRAYERRAGGLVFMSPIDIVLNEYNVLQPDVVFFRGDRVHAINMRRAIRVPPDLSVEILSPATEATDRVRKLRTLAAFGVREYWLIDPLDARIEQYTLDQRQLCLAQLVAPEDDLTSRWLEGLTFPAAAVFVD